MKTSLAISLVLFLGIRSQAQREVNDSLADFDYTHFNEHLSEIKDSTARTNYLQTIQRNFIKRKYSLTTEKTYVSSAVATSTCGNFDFEDGNLAGWTMSGDFQIMSGTGVDPYGNFPVVCNGGNFSLRLNDNNTACSGPTQKVNFTSSASRWITITSANCVFKINWAGAVLNFPHPQSAAANIKIQFFDGSNNIISGLADTILYSSPPNSVVATCPVVYNTPSVLGPQLCSTVGSYSLSYFPWQQRVYNLSSYIGQVVKLNLSADWCLFNYDWGYAYFDVCCDSTCPTVNSSTISSTSCFIGLSNTLCTSKTTNINFQWYDSSGPVGTTTCITVNSPGTYTLISNPPSSPSYSIYEIFTLIPPPSPVSFSVANIYCTSSSPVNLTGSPGGGFFSGPGISGNVLYPGSMSTGSITIYYTYTDPITNCFSTVTETTTIANCTDIKINDKSIELGLSPNPFRNEIIINSKGLPENCEFILCNAFGQEIVRKRLSNGKNTVETEGIPAGLYFYSLSGQNQALKQGKLVKD